MKKELLVELEKELVAKKKFKESEAAVPTKDDFKVIECLMPLTFEDVNDDTAHDICSVVISYKGKEFVVVLSATASAEYIETYHSAATYWDPEESDGFYNVDEDSIEIDGDLFAVFSSREAYKKAKSEVQDLVRYLPGHDYFSKLCKAWDKLSDVDYEDFPYCEQIGMEDTDIEILTLATEDFDPDIGDTYTIDNYYRGRYLDNLED